MKGFLGKQQMFIFSNKWVLLTSSRIQGGAYIHTICFVPHPHTKKPSIITSILHTITRKNANKQLHFKLFMPELRSGHVNKIYNMAPGQTSYSGPKLLPTTLSKSNTTNMYTSRIMSIHD
jgi:hypothetical protein